MQRIACLDGWRAMAILGVLFAHFFTKHGINLGRVGVELFFVLSGRLMAELLFMRQTSLPLFFWRRFSRVYPALFVYATIMLAAGLAGYGSVRSVTYLSAVTFTYNYVFLWTGRDLVLDHIWSLCIEEHVYLLLGALALLHRRLNIQPAQMIALLAAVGILNGVIATLQGLGYNAAYWRTDTRGASILMGALAYLVLRNLQALPRHWQWSPLALFLLGITLNIKLVPDPIKYSLGTACFAACLMLMSSLSSGVRRFLESPLLVRIGTLSYSLYLWQQPFSHLGGHLPVRLLHLAMGVACGLSSFYLVERPSRAWLNKAFLLRRAAL